MKHQQLQLGDGTKLRLWQCGVCGQLASAKDVSERCCTCKGCGCEIKRNEAMYGVWCDSCWSKENARLDQVRFDKAKEVEYDGGPVFTGYNYHRDMDAMIETFGPGEEPEFVHPCDIVHPKLDASSIIENMMENLNVEEISERDLHGVKEFEAAVAAFNKANDGCYQVWEEDTGKKVRVPKIDDAA